MRSAAGRGRWPVTKRGWLRRKAEMAEVVAEALRDVECTSCSRRFEGQAAFQVHADRGQCLPDGAARPAGALAGWPLV